MTICRCLNCFLRELSSGVFFLFFTSMSLAQEYQVDSLRKKYVSENAVVLENSKIYTISFKDKKPTVSAETIEKTIALTDLGISYASEQKLYSSTFIKNKIIEAKTFSRLESGKYKTITATDISEKADIDKNYFFDDNKTLRISFPSVTAGSVTSLKSTEEYKEARLFGVFYFSSYIPTVFSQVVLKVNKNIQIKYLLQGAPDSTIEFSVMQKGQNNYYTWKAKNVAKYYKPESAPDFRYFIPHVIFYITSYRMNKDTVNVLSSIADLYKWYADGVKNVNAQSSEVLKKVCDSLVAGSSNEFEKVKKIFYWVQDNIKYIAFEDGIGGMIPREANAIYEKRYGDCKDMASIITRMLKLVGIKSYLTWLGTRDIPYKYSEIPTPYVDNHMIVAYKDTTGRIWPLDATGKNARIDLYTSMIQGKQALIGLDSTRYELFDIPVVSKEKNKFYDSIHIELNNNVIQGNGQWIINGYPKIHYDYLLSNLSEKDFKGRLKQKLYKGNNTFNLDTYAVLNAEKRDAPTIINYTCKIENYVKSYKDEIYFNFNLDKNELQYIISETRADIPIELDNTLSQTDCVVLEIPKDYDVSYIPKSTSYGNDDFGYKIEYVKEAKSLTMKKYFYCNKLLIRTKDFKEWSKMLKSLNESYKESTILKHK